MKFRCARMAGLALTIGSGVSCGKSAPPPAPVVATVAVVKVQARNVPLTKEWVATIEGSTTAEIRPQVSGYVRKVDYKEGTPVAVGQTLFTLDERPFVAAAKKARGDYENAIAALDKAKADVARYAPLVADHAISREQLDNARASVLAGEGNVQAAKGALDSAELNVEWAQVRSPLQGLAGIAQVRVGTLVNPNQVLTVVSTLDPMRASFNVRQQDYLQYADVMNHPNAPEYASQRYFELLLINGQLYGHRARDIIVNREIDSTTGTLQIQALFANPEGLLRPGLFAKVRLHVGSTQDVPVVPERAVSQLQGQYQVAVVDDQQHVQMRRIEVGQTFDHAYVVESGLRPGEQVVVGAQQNAIPGAKVNVEQARWPESDAGADATSPPRQGD